MSRGVLEHPGLLLIPYPTSSGNMWMPACTILWRNYTSMFVIYFLRFQKQGVRFLILTLMLPDLNSKEVESLCCLSWSMTSDILRKLLKPWHLALHGKFVFHTNGVAKRLGCSYTLDRSNHTTMVHYPLVGVAKPWSVPTHLTDPVIPWCSTILWWSLCEEVISGNSPSKYYVSPAMWSS